MIPRSEIPRGWLGVQSSTRPTVCDLVYIIPHPEYRINIQLRLHLDGSIAQSVYLNLLSAQHRCNTEDRQDVVTTTVGIRGSACLRLRYKI